MMNEIFNSKQLTMKNYMLYALILTMILACKDNQKDRENVQLEQLVVNKSQIIGEEDGVLFRDLNTGWILWQINWRDTDTIAPP